MFRWITVIIALTASIICASYRLRQQNLLQQILLSKRYLIKKIMIAVITANIVYVPVYFLNVNGLFFFVLFTGHIACLAYELILRNRRVLLPEICIYICADMAFLPFCLCDEAVWRYAVYPAFLYLSVLLTLWGEKHKSAGPLEFYPERKKLYRITSVIPCIILAPEILLIILFGAGGVVSAIILHCVFLIMFCLALWLQYEIILRITAEEINLAMNRWQKESRDYMNTIRAQRHDFNLHLHAISGLLAGREYDKCAEYIAGLVSDANAVNDIMPVSDAVVGSMLYNMREEARRQGSDIVYDITYDMAGILCNGFECNKIIGNLLQNAIDALRSPVDREYGIKLSIFKRRGNTVIISENRFTGDPGVIANIFESGYSTKQGHEGIGLSMVLRTVTMYGGRIYPEFDGDIIRFVVNIPNKVNLAEGGDT